MRGAIGKCSLKNELVVPAHYAVGRVAEWLKASDSKSEVRVTVPWVRIPPLPPYIQRLTHIPTLEKVGNLCFLPDKYLTDFHFQASFP